MWPFMSKICIRYKTDSRITEHFCRCLRFMIRLVSRSTTALLAPVAQQVNEWILSIYRVHKYKVLFFFLDGILI